MISNREVPKPFIFIRIPKAASTSIEVALREYINPKLVINYHTKEDKKKKVKPEIARHLTYRDTARYLSDQRISGNCPYCHQCYRDNIKLYYSFAVVRNPWERFVTYWKGILNKLKKIKRDKDHHRDVNKFLTYLSSRWNPFESIKYSIDGNYHFLMQQCQYLTEDIRPRDKFLVNKIVRFENLERDLEKVSADLSLYIKLPATKYSSNEHNHYSEYYSEEGKQMIAEIFKDDIRIFGYKYEKSRNMPVG